MSAHKLMRAMGAKRFDPMPPDQHAFYLAESETDVNRFVAWVWQGTIEINHPAPGYDLRSPYVVDEKGKPRYIEHAAAHFGWDPAYARRILRQARRQGRVKMDGRRICLCGIVHPTEVEEPEELVTAEGEDKAKKKDCTRYVPTYILNEINKQDSQVRKRILSEEAAAADLHDQRVADAMAALRAIRDREQDTRFQKYDLPERRKIAESKQKRRPNLPVTVQLTLVDLDLVQSSPEPGTVQGTDLRTVQGTNGTSHPISIETCSIETTTTAQPVVNSEADVVVVVQKLGVKHSRAQTFVDDCHRASPGCTTDDIVAAIDHVEARINKQTYRNFTPILLETVPLKIAGIRKAAEEWKAANTETCWACHKPIYPEDARMRGAHQTCWDAEERGERGQRR